MTERAGYRRGWSALAAVLTLVLCATTGLGAGTLSRALVGRSSGTVLPLNANASRQQPTNTVPPRAPSATAASAATVAAPGEFSLTVAVTPNQVGPGQRFTVVATVVGQDGVSRVQGIECSMRAPINGAPPLLAQWPSPVVTDADGLATWSLLAPQAPPGRYAVEVIAYGQHQYSYWGDAFVTLVVGTTGG